jgi:hypothetical protein
VENVVSASSKGPEAETIDLTDETDVRPLEQSKEDNEDVEIVQVKTGAKKTSKGKGKRKRKVRKEDREEFESEEYNEELDEFFEEYSESESSDGDEEEDEAEDKEGEDDDDDDCVQIVEVRNNGKSKDNEGAIVEKNVKSTKRQARYWDNCRKLRYRTMRLASDDEKEKEKENEDDDIVSLHEVFMIPDDDEIFPYHYASLSPVGRTKPIRHFTRRPKPIVPTTYLPRCLGTTQEDIVVISYDGPPADMWISLPPELVMEILTWCPPRVIVEQLSKVCRLFRSVALYIMRHRATNFFWYLVCRPNGSPLGFSEEEISDPLSGNVDKNSGNMGWRDVYLRELTYRRRRMESGMNVRQRIAMTCTNMARHTAKQRKTGKQWMQRGKRWSYRHEDPHKYR